MKIIADTNIWYELGQNEELFKKVKDLPIHPTFVNIYELSKSNNLIKIEDVSRAAIRRFFNFKNQVIYEPPFIYLAKLACDYTFDIKLQIGHILEFTSKFAEGEKIREDKIEDFRKWTSGIKKKFDEATEFLNNEATQIRLRITDKKDHREKDTSELTINFISKLVEISTDKKCQLKGFDSKKIELLSKTLDVYFKTLELSTMKMQPNDWFDFAIMSYVHPGDKFWTSDKRWLQLIEEAKCTEYLYVNPK